MNEDEEQSERSPIEEAYEHLARCKRILDEWEEMEKALEAVPINLKTDKIPLLEEATRD